VTTAKEVERSARVKSAEIQAVAAST